MEEAQFLTKFASKVTVIHRREALRASKIMADRAAGNPKISFLWNSAVEEVVGKEENGKKSVTGLKLRDLRTKSLSDLRIDGLFIGIGHQPNTKIFEGQIELDDNGYIMTLGGTTKTSVEGVFAAGDVADSVYRQAVTAAGTGCMAAIDAERFITHHPIQGI
jgi:thioredoxin reductase (NADPH)